MSKRPLKKLSSFANLFFAAFIASISQAHALDHVAKANVRDSDDDIVQANVTLVDLTANDRYEGKYFKVVKGTSNEAIRFTDSEDLNLRAATVYHHLTIARNYFAKQTDIEQPYLNSQVTVRVEQDREFSQFIHFKNADANPDFAVFNMSTTVPPSNDYTDEEVQPWGPEIWFHQAKPESQETAAEKLGKIINSRQFKNPMLLGLLAGDLMTALNYYFEDNQFDDIDLKYTAYSVGLSIALTEVIPWTFELGTKLFSGKVSLDTAMIPEVAYHEYGHIALAKTLEIFNPTSIVEGFPNYFASKIANRIRVADNAGEYNDGFEPKYGDSEEPYTFEIDHKRKFFHGSFVMSLLLELERAFGDEGHAIIKRSLLYLTPKSNVKSGLQRALIHAISDVAKTEGHRRALRASMNAVLLKRKL